MSRLIILEGPDGAGKTTLGLHLQDKYGFRYHHEGPPPAADSPDSLLNYYGQLLYDANNRDEDVVFDRLHLGETIYGPICRQQDQITDEGVLLLNRIIRAYGAKVVICLPPYGVCLANWTARKGQEYVPDLQRFMKIYDRYVSISQQEISRYATVYDYTGANDLSAAATFLMTIVRCEPKLPDGVYGSPSAKFVVVGEIANQEYLDVPFFSRFNSSHYLNTCLWDAGFNEDELCFTNALTLQGSERGFKAILEQMPNRVFITLGAKAAQVLRRQAPTLDIKPVFHPAYWKRFHCTQRDKYIAELEGIRRAYYDITRIGPRSLGRVTGEAS